MHTSIGTKLFICKLDYCLKVDELLVVKKKGICVRICSKFSVKSEAKCKSRLLNGCRLQIGRVGTYRQVLHLTITVCRKVQHKVYIRTNTRKMVPIMGRAST